MADNTASPIAIVGMSCRVAGANSPSKLWEVLCESKDVQSDIRRFSADGFYREDGGKRKGLINVQRGYFMDGGVDRFDNAFFSIPPTEAKAMDPQQRLLLELTYEALENAGIPLDKFVGTNTGVYTGMTWNDYGISLFRDVDMTPKYMSTGACNAIAANRISYFFDLHGPSLVTDTACSSTMVALHQAVTALQRGEVDMAVVNGSNVILNPDIFVCMSELGFLSPTGRCRSFDASGDGYVRAEGVLAMMLKPLDRAVADGDPIRAVIRGTRLNQDGRTQGITLPSSQAQMANMEALYAQAGIDPADIQYFEAHGTGTAAGDPLEMSAISAIYGDSHTAENNNRLVVGSVKSNIGHLEAAAALAGLVKTVLAVEKGQIPPQMHFITPNPKIDFSHVMVPAGAVHAWPATRMPGAPRRAAINSFGFGGTNGHAVIEQYLPRPPTLSVTTTDGSARPFLFKVSAATDDSLTNLAENYADYVESRQPELADLAHTLLARRSTLKKTTFVVASTREELVESLRSGTYDVTSKADPVPGRSIAFVFTGQGAQWPSMGAQLLETSPIFRSIVSRCNAILQSLPECPEWSVETELSRPKATSRVYESSLSQPLCTILQIGLVELWRAWGVRPVAVVGHSSGEVAAAYAAGHLSLRDAVTVAYYRGLYLGSSYRASDAVPGSMCAVGLGETEARKLLQPYNGTLALAAVNSPSSCTLSGDLDAVLDVVDKCKADGTFCRQLRVDMAYHSHHMLPMSSRYEEAMANAGVAVQATQGEGIGCCMFSSVRGREVNPLAFDQDCGPSYWKDNMTSTVQFTAAVNAMFRNMPGLEAVVEIGPHPALKGPFEDTIAELGADAGAALPYFSSCFRGKPDLSAMLESVGRMVAAGLQSLAVDRVNAVELDEQTQRQSIVLSDLPAYAWDHSTSYWAETRVSRNYRLREHPTHELLGARKHTDNPFAMSWRSLITLKSVPWLAEWKEQEHASIIPWSAYILMVSEAASQLATNSRQLVEIDQMQFHKDYPLSNFDSDDSIAEFSFDAFPHAIGSKLDFHISAEDVSSQDKSWIRLCSGTLNLAPDGEEAKRNMINGSVPEPNHDSRIREYAETFPLPGLTRILDVRIDYEAAKGDIASSEDDTSLKEHIVSPLTLHSMLRVPTLAFLKHSQPTEYRLKSIERVTLSPRAATNQNNGMRQFNTSHTRPVNGQASATIQLIGDDEADVLMELQNATYEAGEPLNRSPPLKSLFFAPRIFPDISYLNDTDVPISLDNLLGMVTHKWPMADIAIAGLPPADARAIVSLLPGAQADERPRFRSVTILGSEDEHDVLNPSRVRFVKDLAQKNAFHAVFANPDHVVDAVKAIHPDGVLCITSTTPFESEDDINELHILGSVSTSSPQNWTLTRLGPLTNLDGTVRVSADESDPPRRKLKVIVPPGVLVPAFAFEAINAASVEIVYLADPSATYSLTEETFDAVVLDLGLESSILTASAGSELLPWVQTMLKNVGLLIWASVQLPNKPHTAVDGAFIRTLRTEDPTLVAASVVFQSPSHDQDGAGAEQQAVYSVLADIHAAMRHGNVETELLVRNGRVHALRYVPDDELAALIGAGVAAPLSKQRSLGDHEYRLSHQGGGRVQALVHPTPVTGLGENQTYHVEVVVEASLIDLEDVSRLASSTSPYANSDLGGFFVGRVCDAQNTRVFGWAPTAHQRRVYLSREAVIPLSAEVNVADALSSSAHRVVALLVLDEMARVRAGDKICTLRVPQPLDTALKHVAAMRKATMVQTRDISDADVVISYDSYLGLVVNGRTISLHRLLSRKSLASFVSEATLSIQARHEVETFPISSYKQAFAYSTKHSAPAVLLHPLAGGDGAACSSVAAPKEPGAVQTLFRPDGAYVVLGGLGGLGRYLCEWIVKRGARHIVTLSRRGSATAGVSELMSLLAGLGATLTVLCGDASDADQLTDALAQVRPKMPIRGCLNMAMVLDDSPISTMTAAQWDAPLRAKVATGWNLHNATLDDSLDFFILFSSVVSMTGNRTQASYATGNSFLNRLAAERRASGRTGVSVAVPAMSGIGVLADNESLLAYFDTAGLAAGGEHELESFMEAAVRESHRPDGRSFIGMGLQMFAAVDGVLQTRPSQNQVFWADFADFGCLMDHRRELSGSGGSDNRHLGEQLRAAEEEEAHSLLLSHFLPCLANVLGYKLEALDPSSSIAACGLDSLNAVACRYWFFKEVSVDVAVFDILGCRSINELAIRVVSKLKDEAGAAKATVSLPEPCHLPENSLRPLSQSQRRLWFLHKLLADKTVYNLLLICHIEGTVQVSLLEQAWQTLFDRHEVLRSRIVDTPDGLQQLPAHGYKFQLDVVECSDVDYAVKMEQLTNTARSHEFSPEDGELVRCWLLKSPSSAALFLASHHLAWDRSSVNVVFDEVTTIYKSLADGKAPDASLEPVDFQFVDFTHWQNQCLSMDAFKDPLITYWREQLEGIPESVSLLPLAHTDRRPTIKQHVTGTTSLTLDSALGRRIKSFCASHTLTPFMFMTAAVAALVGRLTGDRDVVVGITDGDRGHSAFDRLVGFSVNMLPIRCRIDPEGDMSILDLLEQFRTSCLQAYEHRALPFDLLLQNLPGLPRRTAHGPVFQIMVNYQMHGSFAPVDFGHDFRFARYDHFNARNETDFTLDVEEAPDASLHCVFEFDTALYRASRMDEFARIYSTFVSHIVDCDGQLEFSAVPLVSAEDEALIAAVLQPPVPNQPEADVLFDTLFARAVSRFPDKIAIVDDNFGGSRQKLTYAEIDFATQAITSTLLRDGAGPGDVVGVSCEPGVAMVLAIYGVLRAGCAYVAVGDAPEERLRGMVTDVGMRHAIVDGTRAADQLVASGLDTSRVYDTGDLLSLTTDSTSISGQPSSSRAVVQKPWALRADDPLCCIFTSGSTGRPKGVYLTHGQVRRWQLGYHAGIEHNANDTLLLASAPTFDLSLASIYGAIARGSTLVVASREARYSGSKMVDVLVDNRVSNLVITPTQFAAVLKAPNSHKLRNWKQLRSLTLGGEIVAHHLVRSFYGLGLPNASVWNLYGPSEATISVSIRRLNLDDHNSPLGPPHSPARMYILDQQRKPVPFGVPGELYIGGTGICTGYIKRPDQTKDAFLTDKFAELEGLEHASPLMYRTGDLFCLDRDGTLTTRGRIGGDRQVKIRGMRTELDEIEVSIQDALDSCIPAHNGGQIASLAVVYRKDEEMLVAYLATDDAEGQGDTVLSPTEQQELTRYLRFALQSVLPAHMRPGFYTFVGQLPSTISGKMDYRAIAAFPPPSQDAAVEEILSSSASSSDLSDVQAEIADTWRQVLPIESTPLLATDDFFSVGGHSLALIQLRAGIVERFGVHLSLTDIFADPSLEGMEKLVLDGLAGAPDHLQNGVNRVNGLDTGRRGTQVDWAAEATLPLELMATNASRPTAQLPMTAVALTGASTMMGVHVLQRLLTTTNLQVYCLAEPGLNSAETYDGILEALRNYGLAADSVDSAGSLGVAMSSRIHAFTGALSHPTLGLSETDIRSIDAEVQAIFHLASDVSLFGNVERVRDGNLGAVKFLLGLAQGLWHGGKTQSVPPKAFHYLSSWGVPHLQAWHDTEIVRASSSDTKHLIATKGSSVPVRKDEQVLSHILPGSSTQLAYLKVRWACEALINAAAEQPGGLERATIFRGSMCATGSAARGLPRDDINRRIIEAALETGMVPDFGSSNGGGMSWITADYLAAAIVHLALRPDEGKVADEGRDISGEHQDGGAGAKVWHLVQGRGGHHTYADMVALLGTGYDGQRLRLVRPEECFAALRATGSADMAMHAAVLEEWCAAGWVPFELDSTRTLEVLEHEAGIRPPTIDRELLLSRVVGERGF